MARRLSFLLTSVMLAGAAQAAELGEVRVSSHIGQQLVADIELTLIEDSAAQVGVRLARPDVYRGANLAMPPVLSSLNMSVMRRDGRQFLHVTSLKPVESEHLHLYLELDDGASRTVRLATLWLTPDPHPAPVPEPVRQPAPEPAAQDAAKPLQEVAAAAARQPARPRVPARPVQAEDAPRARPAPAEAKASPLAAAAASDGGEARFCAPQVPSEQIEVCMALGVKNAALREQIVALEEKVGVLQVAMGAGPARAMGEGQPAPPRQARTSRRVAEPASAVPWLWLGAAVLALLALAGAAVGYRARRATARAPAVQPPAESFMSRVKQRLMPGSRTAAPSDSPAEPTLE